MTKGCRGFSEGVDRLVEQRIFREGTVDAVLQDSSLAVTSKRYERFEAAPDLEVFQFQEIRRRRFLLTTLVDSLGLQELAPLERLQRLAEFTANIEHSFPSPEHPAAKGYYKKPTDYYWGGTEEFIIAKGGDWCGEIARVYCSLAQISGIPSRVVHIFSQNDGHVIAECFIEGQWVLVDPQAVKVYSDEHGTPIGIVDMMRADPTRRAKWTAGREGYYVNEEFFQFVTVSEYRLIDASLYDYSLSPCNDYFRELLTPMWNGGSGE